MDRRPGGPRGPLYPGVPEPGEGPGGGNVAKPADPKKEGKVFGGWYFSPSKSGESGADYKWNFSKFILPYLNNPSAAYVFEARWLEPGETPEPDLDEQPPSTIYGGIKGGLRFYEPRRPIQVTSVSLNKTSAVLHVDGEDKDDLVLIPTVEPYNADDRTVRWSSSNPDVATVENGLVYAQSAGEATITCTSVMVPSISASCKVQVYSPIYVKSIDLDKTTGELYAGEAGRDTLQLNATVNPSNATYSSTHWLSSDESVAYVDEKGLVTGLSAGTATITCMSVKNQDVKSVCEVTVHQRVEDIFLNADREGLVPGETAKLSAVCYPVNSDNRQVVWSSSDPSVATVDAQSVVTAVGYGDAVITATAADGGGAFGVRTVTVEPELTLVTNVENDTLYLGGGDTALIGYVFASQGSVRRMIEKGYDLEWTLKNGDEAVASASLEDLATIYSVGGKDYEISAAALFIDALNGAGSLNYTIECKAGPYTAEARLPVTVSGAASASEVTLDTTKFELELNEAAHLPNAPVALNGGSLPEGLMVSLQGDDYFLSQAIVSEDEDGLSVRFEESGLYTANAVFSAANMRYVVPVTFEVRDEDGLVHLPVTSLGVKDAYVNVVVGETYPLEAVVGPADAYDPSVSWTSGDETIATVSDDGLVTAVSRGTVYITCHTEDGSNLSASCLVNVEPFMALDESLIERTVYMSGDTRATLDTCSLTFESAQRIDAAGITPDWTLRRVSGDATEIALSQFDGIAAGSTRVEGQGIELLRLNHAGTDEYELILLSN